MKFNFKPRAFGAALTFLLLFFSVKVFAQRNLFFSSLSQGFSEADFKQAITDGLADNNCNASDIVCGTTKDKAQYMCEAHSDICSHPGGKFDKYEGCPEGSTSQAQHWWLQLPGGAARGLGYAAQKMDLTAGMNTSMSRSFMNKRLCVDDKKAAAYLAEQYEKFNASCMGRVECYVNSTSQIQNGGGAKDATK